MLGHRAFQGRLNEALYPDRGKPRLWLWMNEEKGMFVQNVHNDQLQKIGTGQ